MKDLIIQVTPTLPIKFRVVGLSVQDKKFKKDFQDGDCGGHIGFPIRLSLAIFDLQIASLLSTKLRVKWPFGLGEEAQNDDTNLGPVVQS